MDRRLFIGLSLGALSGSSLGAREQSYAARLGTEILRERLVPADAPALRAILGVEGLPVSGILARSWQQDIRRDFAAARTVTVSGWILSETEARICAVMALEGA